MLETYRFLIDIIFILLHFCLFVYNYQIMGKKIMQPAVLFSFLWFMILLARFIFSFTILYELYPIHVSTYLVFFIGGLVFSFGSFLQTAVWQKKRLSKRVKKAVYNAEIKISSSLRNILLLIVIVGLPFYIMASYRLFLISNIDDFFIGLRTELVYGDQDIGFTKYLIPLSFIVFAVNLYFYHNKRNRLNLALTILSLLLTVTYVVFFTGRGLFVIILSIYIGMSYLYDKIFSFKKMLIVFTLFMLVFILFGVVYGKGGSKFYSLKENIEPITETTAIYLVTSLNALDLQLQNAETIDYSGNNSFRFFKKAAEQAGLVKNPKVLKLEGDFVFVPYTTNVFTVYSPYIKDFGKLYAWFMIAFFGFIHTWVYNKAITTKSFKFSLYYSFLLFPLLISFFMDFYLNITSMWIQIIFYTEGFLFLNRVFNADSNKRQELKITNLSTS